jgi:tetratricopeptide (TPR) repeat protein
MRDVDRELARHAAEVSAGRAETRESRDDWELKAATMSALLGDTSKVDELWAKNLANASARPKELSKFYWIYTELKQFDRAIEVALAAYTALPTDAGAATAMCEAEAARGDHAAARAVAEKLIVDRPYAHAGFERLALVAGAELDEKTALDASAKSLESAPTCSVAHRARSLALFVSGDVAGAKAHAKHAIRLDVPNADREERWPVAFLAALEGDAKAMAPYLATLAPNEAERKAPYLAKLEAAPPPAIE